MRYHSLAIVAGLLLGFLLWLESPAQTTPAIVPVTIPDVWRNPPSGKLQSQDGFSWYRCRVRLPADWRGKEVSLFLEPMDDARSIYVNGTLVGAAGTFPPRYRSGLGEPSRHRVPPALLKFGADNVIAVRMYYNEGRSNFSVAAPILLVDRQAIRLEGAWQARAGDDPAWGKQPDQLSELPSFAKIDVVDQVDLYVQRRKGDRDPLPPGEALKRFKVASDLQLSLVLSEPHIGQPLQLSWDERGRLWVVEYLQYPDPAGLKMISRDKFLRTVYDRVPPPPPQHFKGADRISVHEDTDGDGQLDRHRVFVEGLNIATACARGRGGVWVLNPPYLLFYADRDGNDVPDGDPVVHLEGFGLEDSHSVANSLCWGPDGWLYGAQGSTVTGHMRRPGASEVVQSMGQLIWRYHPEKRRYEIFAEGGGNTFGVEIDAKGRIYSGHNGGDTRGFHYVQGGYFQKGFSKHGSLSNPYAFGYLPQMKHPPVQRFTHTFLLYDSTQLPPRYRGQLLGVEPLQGQVVLSEFRPDGSTFQTRDLTRPLTTDDPWFRPVDIKLGPDGAVYVADFYEQRIDHSSHYAGRISRTTGRVYRLGADAEHKPIGDLSKRSSLELVELLKHPNRWQRQTALRLLGDRKDRTLIPVLSQLIKDSNGQTALEALWALHLSGGLTEATALTTLDHADPHVRLWTIRLLADDNQVSRMLAEKMIALAARESHVEVRSQLACSLQRLPAEQSLPVLRALLQGREDGTDIHLPLLLWWVLEKKASEKPEAVLAWLADRTIWSAPMFQQHLASRVMRRFAQAGKRKDLLQSARLLQLAPDRANQQALLSGFEQAFQGRSLSGLPDELLQAIAKAGGGSPLLRLRQGERQALDEALVLIGNDKAEIKTRLAYIQTLGEIDAPASIPPLLALLEKANSPALQQSALTALQAYDDPRIGKTVVAALPRLTDDVRAAALTLLASRKSWSRELLQTVQTGKMKPAQVPTEIVRQLLLHDDRPLREAIQTTWGKLPGASPEEVRQRRERLEQVLASASGNPYQGRRLYAQHCGRCHTLFGEGGQVGPDLTPFDRKDLARLMSNILNPSQEIREGFESFVAETKTGRVLTGFLADQDNRVVVLRGAEGQNYVLPRDQLDDFRRSDRSVMPDDTLAGLSDQQLRDLFAYVRSSQPLP